MSFLETGKRCFFVITIVSLLIRNDIWYNQIYQNGFDPKNVQKDDLIHKFVDDQNITNIAKVKKQTQQIKIQKPPKSVYKDDLIHKTWDDSNITMTKIFINNQTQQIPLRMKSQIPQQKSDLKVIFIHIGKTGGSSGRCMLKFPLRESFCKRPKQAKKFTNEALGEGYLAIREKTVAMFHVNTLNTLRGRSRLHLPIGKYIRNHYGAALVSIRNPVERLISWYLYTKERVLANEREMKSEIYYQILFQKCNHQSVGEFFSDLSLEVQTNNTECQSTVRKCVIGDRSCYGHNSLNYTYYLKDLLDENIDLPRVRIFAVRNEHKWKDFEKINIMLGGSAQSLSSLGKESIHLRQTRESKDVSKQSRIILCSLLCKDIYHYAKIIHFAENLHRDERNEAIEELNLSCYSNVETLCYKYNFNF